MPTPNPRTEVSSKATPPKRHTNRIQVSEHLIEAARAEVNDVLTKLRTSPSGLTQTDVDERQQTYGPNEVAAETKHGWLWRLMMSLRNPLVVLLGALAAVSFVTGDIEAGSVMSLMVVLGVLLKFIQETRADTAAAKLKAMIKVTATVIHKKSRSKIWCPAILSNSLRGI
jgi:Mg2+-importing ATPase